MPTNLMPTNYSLTTNWYHVIATNWYGYREIGGHKIHFWEKTNLMPTNFMPTNFICDLQPAGDLISKCEEVT